MVRCVVTSLTTPIRTTIGPIVVHSTSLRGGIQERQEEPGRPLVFDCAWSEGLLLQGTAMEPGALFRATFNGETDLTADSLKSAPVIHWTRIWGLWA